MADAASSSAGERRSRRGKKEDKEFNPDGTAIDDESSLAKEEGLPQGDTKAEVSALEGDLDIPVEEVIRRMQERAAAAGDDDDDDEEEEEEEESEGEEDDDEDDDDEEGEEGSEEEGSEEEEEKKPKKKQKSE